MGQQWKVQGYDERNTKKGPRDVVDVSWAIGEFFLYFYIHSADRFFFANGLRNGACSTVQRGERKKGAQDTSKCLGL